MKKKIIVFVACCFLLSTAMQAQKITRVAVFAALYLDSLFDNNDYQYKKTVPKFALQGIDFVQGVKVALDSFDLGENQVRARIFDSKSQATLIDNLIRNKTLDSFELIIAGVSGSELSKLASFAKMRNIPLVSALTPSDAGVTQNPFFMITNATLKGHCESIYSYVLQKHGTDNIYIVKQTGQQEDKIVNYFRSINEQDGSALLPIKVLTLDTSLSEIDKLVDSNSTSIFIGASLADTFAYKLVKKVNELKDNYSTVVFGMPNWNLFNELKRADVKDYPVIYTTSFYNGKADAFSKKLQSVYLRRFKASPTENTYKGFEAAYLFIQLIQKHPLDFSAHLNEAEKQVFGEFNFKPVYLKKNSALPDYFENKHLYFMKLIEGKSVRMY
jgi:Periplasmic binding protein